MPDGLYEHDILTWAEQQAALLRRLAKGERVDAAVDWPHVIEELQDVGLAELRACESLLPPGAASSARAAPLAGRTRRALALGDARLPGGRAGTVHAVDAGEDQSRLTLSEGCGAGPGRRTG